MSAAARRKTDPGVSARLRRAWERTRTVPGLGRDVAALLVLVLLGTSACAFVLAHQRYDWPWQDKFEFEAEFAEAPGISPGNGQEVRIAGVTVGKIKEAELTDDGTALLTLSIEPGYDIYKDARLVLRPKTPLNDMYVEMSQGTEDAGSLPEHGLVPVEQTANPVQVDRVLQNLDDDARAGISAMLQEADVALANAPAHLPEGLAATDRTMRDMRPLLRALHKRRDLLADLVTSLGQVSQTVGGDEQRLARLTTSLAETLDTITARDDELDETLAQVPGFVEELRHATGSVDALGQQLDPTLQSIDSASADLPTALHDVGALADQLDATVKEATPLVVEARPLVADLRPVAPRLDAALGDVAPLSGRLDSASDLLVDYIDDLSAFVYNTASIFSLGDANGGILRGQAQVNATSLPFKIGQN